MKVKWIWEEDWANRCSVGQGLPDGSIKHYKQSRCINVVPGCEIFAYERYAFGKFAIRMIFRNTHWLDEKILDVCLPNNVKTLACAQRKAPAVIKEEITRILREQTTKYQNILDHLNK